MNVTLSFPLDPSGYNAAAGQPTAITTYDKNGNKVLVEDPHHTKTKTVVDTRNRPTKVIVDLNGDGVFDENFNGADTVSETHYNLVDKPIRILDSRGNATETEYDRAYRVVLARGPQVIDAEHGGNNVRPETRSEYDKNSNVVLVVDPRGVQTKTEYDELNRARKVTAAFGTVDAVTTEKQYDERSNVLALILHNRVDADGNGVLDTDRPQVTSYEFDCFNRQVREMLPDVADELVRQTTSTYYRNGQVKTVTDAKGQIVESSYDRANRVLETRHKRADGSLEETRTFAYNKVGKPLDITDLSGATHYDYDALYRVVRERRTDVGESTYSVLSFYDFAGNRTKCVYPNPAGTEGAGRTLISTYDRLNRLTRMDDAGALSVYTYDSNGNRESLSLPNGAVDTYGYDALNRVSLHTATRGGSLIYSSLYGYDLVGNRVTITEQVADATPGNPLRGRNLSYTYDSQYRLKSESWPSDGGVPGESREYTFDLAGNRLTQVHTKDGVTETTGSVYDDLNRLLSTEKVSSAPDSVAEVTTYDYDINGNRTSKTRAGKIDLLTWDVNDRLVRVEREGLQVFTAAYDYRTRRVHKWEVEPSGLSKATVFRYDQGDSFQEIEAGITNVEFVRGSGMGGGIGSILYSDRTSSGGVVEYFHFNAVGHTVATSNAGGQVQSSNLYEAYGNIVLSTGASQNNRLANTKERDFSIGLDNHGFRYYDPECGRYISRDPIGYGDGPNVYIYVHCNPINFVDPLGLDDEEKWIWHHDAAQEIFRGKDGKASYIAGKGMKLEDGLDIDSPEFGRMFKAKFHTGTGGIHPEGWNADWKDVVDSWGKKRIVTRQMINEGIEKLYGMDKYKAALMQSRDAIMHYSAWRNVAMKDEIYAALRAEDGLADFSHLEKGKKWGNLRLLKKARDVASTIAGVAKPLGIGMSAYLLYIGVSGGKTVNAATYDVVNEELMGAPDVVVGGAKALDEEFVKTSTRARNQVSANPKDLDRIENGMGRVQTAPFPKSTSYWGPKWDHFWKQTKHFVRNGPDPDE